MTLRRFACALLWRAVVRRRRWLVWATFVVAAHPAVVQAAQIVYVHFFRRLA